MTAAHSRVGNIKNGLMIFSDDRIQDRLTRCRRGVAGVGRALYWIPAGLRRALPLLLSDRLFVALRIWRRASATRPSLRTSSTTIPIHVFLPPSTTTTHFHSPSFPAPPSSAASFLISRLLQHPQQNQERLAFHLFRPADAKALHIHVAAMFVRKRGMSLYLHNADCFELYLTLM